MNLFNGLDKEATALVERHRDVLERVPRTILANTLVELQKWQDMFEPEKTYFRTLLDNLSALPPEKFHELFGGLAQVESETGCSRVDGASAAEVQKKTLDLLREKGEFSRWREEVDKIFRQLDPEIESQNYGTDNQPRLVVMIYGEGIAIEHEKLWRHFRETGLRIALSLGESQASSPFLTELFTGRHLSPASEPAPSLFDALVESGRFAPSDNWMVEVGDELHALCEKSQKPKGANAVGLSYQRLRQYRERLSDAITSKVTEGKVSDPVELHNWLRTLEAKPQEGISLYSDRVVTSFIRDIFVLGGNGTLIINNSFVEWSSVEALRRAQPRVLVARFGVRDKMKPFSSLLLFSKPRSSDQIPIMEDPLGSFIDVEKLSYYIWLKSKDTLPYRGHTLYLLLAEGVEEMLALVPGRENQKSQADAPPATLPEVAATMAQWLGVQFPGTETSPIRAILS
jgi:hypothetical protein